MPGLLVQNQTSADLVVYTPTGTISSTTVQSAVAEVSSDVTSVEGIALLGL
jgi:hypothetical protein